ADGFVNDFPITVTIRTASPTIAFVSRLLVPNQSQEILAATVTAMVSITIMAKDHAAVCSCSNSSNRHGVPSPSKSFVTGLQSLLFRGFSAVSVSGSLSSNRYSKESY
ncbi:hypothetical protein BaRGS_00001083, partial [Batillaria attramentaria]